MKNKKIDSIILYDSLMYAFKDVMPIVCFGIFIKLFYPNGGIVAFIGYSTIILTLFLSIYNTSFKKNAND